ncbi:MAG: hypothetical protein A3F72_17100 [Bacteroidetes bacterium RIFCSPLOWO2_12_FULL_35_15]|nr:MAG: hypothetical protein A3F72_17100 [Bacteroidetes bacterium RIFCSPLOWO2_12_FULL_35_15]
MNQHSITYPQYRKYPNNKAYFKIISATEWEEIQVIGSKSFLHYFTVKILPDRNFIYDMTFDYERNWVAIEESEYESHRKNAEEKKQ